ncbi:MAG: ParB/RepB/Spo0J family partition protein [Clostridia bacterium]|nr:ParB/RepB/Spo0J family partition protein [Clostridia bacterium]
MMPLARLHPFREHPYHVREDAELNALRDSIEQNGILSPILVRPLEGTDDYEIISGHRRAKAAELAGLTEVPIIVTDIDRDDAIVQMVDSNLHREHLLPSEKAFAYKMKLEAMKHQGTLCQVGTKSRSDEMLADDSGESARTVQRYIRLTNLIPELLECMDRGEMALTVGEALSYLSEEMQYAVLDAMEEQGCTPSLSQACRMKKLFLDGQLTEDDVFDILAEEKANQREMVKIPLDVLQLFFPDYTPLQIKNAIVRMLEQQKKPQKRSREEER